jgi:hypothetical protein
MENKNNVSLYSIIFLVVGVLLGWLVWGNDSTNRNQMMGNMHQMPDGTMMQGNDMTSMMARLVTVNSLLVRPGCLLVWRTRTMAGSRMIGPFLVSRPALGSRS